MTELMSFQCIEMAVFAMSGLTGTYQVLNGASQQADTGSVGFQDDIKILKIYNDDGTQGITFSFDGVVKNDYLPPKGTMIIDLQANHACDAGAQGTKNGRKGQLIHGKGTAGTANLYIIGYR